MFWKRNEKLLQPVDRFQIQVVGRLVQQQDVGVAEQGLGQQHPDLFAPFQLLHLLLAQLFGDAQAVEQHRRLGLRLVAVHLGELRLQFAGADAVLLVNSPLA